ncbi:hypothetical protein mRhiFer1_009003 [Rhinolophus ferrumequinum]|uniref:Uncharacterized protein n=1 Tax=Rhinolophus ferrumequinum TaxID=59479 RepID=A0A7J7TEL3_RHIFE|nr:hypothetical protein mRhiFer1_009003 [Rhinolophus ferrumequinum]
MSSVACVILRNQKQPKCPTAGHWLDRYMSTDRPSPLAQDRLGTSAEIPSSWETPEPQKPGRLVAINTPWYGRARDYYEAVTSDRWSSVLTWKRSQRGGAGGQEPFADVVWELGCEGGATFYAFVPLDSFTLCVYGFYNYKNIF